MSAEELQMVLQFLASASGDAARLAIFWIVAKYGAGWICAFTVPAVFGVVLWKLIHEIGQCNRPSKY